MENYHRRYREPKIDPSMQGMADARLGYTIEQIRSHCSRITRENSTDEANCINLNCSAQKYYVECFEVYKDKKTCLNLIKKEVEQNGMYKVSHLKLN
jgi:hypothetical protein